MYTVQCLVYKCPNSVFNVKEIVGAFNQEKTLDRGLLRDFEIFLNLRLQL